MERTQLDDDAINLMMQLSIEGVGYDRDLAENEPAPGRIDRHASGAATLAVDLTEVVVGEISDAVKPLLIESMPSGRVTSIEQSQGDFYTCQIKVCFRNETQAMAICDAFRAACVIASSQPPPSGKGEG